MTVICADDQTVLARILYDVQKIVVSLASDVETVIPHNVLVERFSAFFDASGQFMNQIRNPLRLDFYETEPQRWKFLRDFLVNDRVKCNQDGKLEL